MSDTDGTHGLTRMPASPVGSAARRPQPVPRVTDDGAASPSADTPPSDVPAGFRRQALVTLLGAVVPGAGLIAAGRRRAGAAVLAVFLLAVGVFAIVVLRRGVVDFGSTIAVEPGALQNLAVAVIVLAVLWCALIAVTAVVARPRPSSRGQRWLAGALVAVLCLAVALPAGFTVRYAVIQRSLLISVFADDPGDSGGPPPLPGIATPRKHTGSSDPWRQTPRVNVLLLGGDAGADRTGLRPDSVVVASIDTHTGNTVLISLPRNLENVPFPSRDPLHKVWPNGYDCGDVCLLNAVWEEARARSDLFPGDPLPGLTATRDAVSAVTGLRLDYYMLVDLRGFPRVIDALGGVTVNVTRRIPIGGGTNLSTGAPLPIVGWISAGRQHLNGYKALWFARSREGSDDYDRMRRQRCLIGDVVDQANPLRVLRAFPKLVSSAKNSISTDIPRRDLPAWVVLARRVTAGTISSLAFTSDVISPGHPDFAKMRKLVHAALIPTPASASPSPSKPAAPSATPSRRAGTTKPPTKTLEDLSKVC